MQPVTITEQRDSPMGRPLKVRILRARFHRNGICGRGFYAVRFREHRKPESEYLAVVTSQETEDGKESLADCYVLSASGDVSECWRGHDHFGKVLWQGIQELGDEVFK